MVGRRHTFLVPNTWHSAWHTDKQNILLGTGTATESVVNPFFHSSRGRESTHDCYWNGHLSAPGTCSCLCRTPGGLVYKTARKLAAPLLCFLCPDEKAVLFLFFIECIGCSGIEMHDEWKMADLDSIMWMINTRHHGSVCKHRASNLNCPLNIWHPAPCVSKDNLSPLLFRNDG